MGSSNRIRDAFDSVTASEELKSRTKEYLQAARQQESLREAGQEGWQVAKRRKQQWESLERQRAKRRERQFRAGKASLRLEFGLLCALLVLFLGMGGYTFLMIPVSYVSIDVNPSMELALNRLDRVISAEAYNEDGEAILNAISVSWMYYTDAVEQMVGSEAMQPYLSENAGLTFTVATDSGQREDALLSGIEATSGYQEHGGVGYGADIATVQEAHECGLSLGKYAAYQVLSQYDSSVTTQDCHDMTMSEIHGLIEEHAHSHESEEHGHGHEDEHGHR